MRYLLLMIVVLTLSASEPSSYRIAMAAPFTQPNAYACGPASSKMLLDYWGPTVAYSDVANVVRLTSNGTAVGDIIRAGHFSRLSAAQGKTGAIPPLTGYPDRPMGLAALAHAQATSWLPEVKALIRQNIPVLMLMQFSAISAGGHYRIAMGYDDAAKIMWFADPWGRELKGERDAQGFQPFSYSDIEICWTYTGYGTAIPHWGAIYVPWNVAISTSRNKNDLVVQAITTYPCPAPFNAAQFPASQTVSTISVPNGWSIKGAPTFSVGALSAGKQAISTWNVVPGAFPAMIQVISEGRVSGSLPATGPYDGTAGEGQIYPAYSYSDIIGGAATLTLGTNG